MEKIDSANLWIFNNGSEMDSYGNNFNTNNLFSQGNSWFYKYSGEKMRE